MKKTIVKHKSSWSTKLHEVGYAARTAAILVPLTGVVKEVTPFIGAAFKEAKRQYLGWELGRFIASGVPIPETRRQVKTALIVGGSLALALIIANSKRSN